MKKFWKYFTLTILFLLGLCCVGILYLFFVPGSSLFGICYKSYNNYYKSESYNSEKYKTIVLNSNDYDVHIVESTNDDISVRVYSNSLGFFLTKNSNTKISPVVNLEKETLTFNITEPNGLAFNNSSRIDLSIPADMQFNITLKNNKASTFISNENIIINNLTYTTNNGDFSISKAELNGDLKLNLNKADFKISDNTKTNLNDVELSLTSGRFLASDSKFNNVSIKENTRGIVKLKECENITQDTKTAGGSIEIETASFANIKSSSTNVNINNIMNGGIITLSENGDVKINKLIGRTSIVTNSGNININEVSSYLNVETILDIETISGNINIANAYENINLKTKTGTANIVYHKDATNKYLSAETSNGKIIASGLEKVNLLITNNGRAEIDMSDIVDTSSINGKKGSIFVRVNKNSKYKLVTKSESSVRVNLAQIPNYGGYTTGEETTTYVNCSETTFGNNVLNVSTTSGDLTILDTNFA